MRLVVDTNILFSFFWRDSVTRDMVLSSDIVLYSPELALEEINRNEEEILSKTGITATEFRSLRRELAVAVEFTPRDDSSFSKALKISPDPKDVDFLALALKLKIPLWSNENRLKRQHLVEVLSTRELLDMPEFFELVNRNTH